MNIIDKHFTNVSIAFLFFLCSLFSMQSVCFADIKKDILTDRVEKDINKVFDTTIDYSGDTGKKAIATQTAHRLAYTIQSLHTDNINSKLADWIDSSFVDIVKQNSAQLLINEHSHNTLLNDLLNQANIRFSTLNDKKGLELYNQSIDLERSSNEYHSDFRKFLITSLDRPGIMRLNLGMPRSNGLMNTSLGQVLTSLNGDPTLVEIFDQQNGADLHQMPTESHLLTLAFLRQIELELRRKKKTDHFSFCNLFSRAFDDGDPLGVRRIKTFSGTLKQINKIYSSVVIVTANDTNIDLAGLRTLIMQATTLRVSEIPLSSFKHDNPKPIFVTFTNAADLWKLAN